MCASEPHCSGCATPLKTRANGFGHDFKVFEANSFAAIQPRPGCILGDPCCGRARWRVEGCRFGLGFRRHESRDEHDEKDMRTISLWFSVALLACASSTPNAAPPLGPMAKPDVLPIPPTSTPQVSRDAVDASAISRKRADRTRPVLSSLGRCQSERIPALGVQVDPLCKRGPRRRRRQKEDADPRRGPRRRPWRES